MSKIIPTAMISIQNPQILSSEIRRDLNRWSSKRSVVEVDGLHADGGVQVHERGGDIAIARGLQRHQACSTIEGSALCYTQDCTRRPGGGVDPPPERWGATITAPHRKNSTQGKR